MAARESILAAVRAGLDGGRHNPGVIAAEAAALLASPELIRPRLPNTSLVELFAERPAPPKLGHHPGAGGEPERAAGGRAALPDRARPAVHHSPPAHGRAEGARLA